MMQLHAIAERITRLHCGRSVQDVMSDSDACTQRGLLYMALEAAGYHGRNGYKALGAHYGRSEARCDRDWSSGMAAYNSMPLFRRSYEHIVLKLQTDAEGA